MIADVVAGLIAILVIIAPMIILAALHELVADIIAYIKYRHNHPRLYSRKKYKLDYKSIAYYDRMEKRK